MTAETILTKFRDITRLTTSQFSDEDVTDKAEPYALSVYNKIMDASETITDHTTGDDLVDETITYFCAEFAFRRLYFKRAWNDKNTSDEFMQLGLQLINYVDPSKVAYDEHSGRYYSRYNKKGKPLFSLGIGEYS